jgi:hypothetical protein
MTRYAAFLAVALRGGPALACILTSYSTHETAPDPEDEAPPAQVREVSVDVRRGRGPGGGGCDGESSTSCDDLGRIALHVEPPADDRSAPEAIGYRLELVEGELPEGVRLPTEPVRPDGASIGLVWVDGADDAQERVSFSLRLIPVDASGREGPPSEPVEVFDPGQEVACSAFGGAGGAPLWLLALGLGVLRRRR